MGIGGSGAVPGQRMDATLEAMKEVGKDTAEEVRAEQKTANQAAQASNAQTVFRSKTPRTQKKLKTRSKTVTKLAKMKKEKRLLPAQKLKKKTMSVKAKTKALKQKRQLKQIVLGEVCR